VQCVSVSDRTLAAGISRHAKRAWRRAGAPRAICITWVAMISSSRGELPSSKMFQLKRWNKGIVQREGRDLRITVSRPGTFGNGIVWAIIILSMVCGFFILFVPPMLRVTSPGDLLWKGLPALVFGVPFFLIFRRLFEREFADQIVTVSAGRITWARKTKWWTRMRHMNADEVTDISASTGWSGLGRVDIRAKGRRRTILDQLLNADAVRFAREVKQTIRDQ